MTAPTPGTGTFPIPADHIAINGDTAWVVIRRCPEPRGQQSMHKDCHLGLKILDRPDCHGTGRHTFEIEVECDEPDIRKVENQGWHSGPTCDSRQCRNGRFSLAVSVVPGMVLELTKDWSDWRALTQMPVIVETGMWVAKLDIHR